MNRHDHPNDPDAPRWMVEAGLWLCALPALFCVALYFIDGPQEAVERDWFTVEVVE